MEITILVALYVHLKMQFLKTKRQNILNQTAKNACVSLNLNYMQFYTQYTEV